MQNTQTQIMSPTEKQCLNEIINESLPLNFPVRKLKMAIGPDAIEYIIPRKEKEAVLNALYPFSKTPSMNDTRYCLHEGKEFKVRNFKVIREDNRNYMVSPDYANTGGMVIDWIEPEDVATDEPIITPQQTPR